MATIVSHKTTTREIPRLATTDDVAAQSDPSVVSIAYAAQAKHWELIRDCLEGTPRMREKASTYLPQHFREHEDNYKNRRDRATFLNVTEDAVDNVVAHPFEKEFTLTEDSSPAAHYLSRDIDCQGNSLHTFGRRAFRDGIIDGFVGIMVEHTPLAEGATLADEIKSGARPYLMSIPAQRILAAYTTVVGGQKIFTHVRIAEEAVQRKGFTERRFKRVRVYDVRAFEGQPPGSPAACHWELWQQGDIDKPSDATWRVIDSGILRIAPNVAWDRVPLFIWYAGKFIDDAHVKPPFLDLAHKNIQHFRVESDYDNVERQTCYPMLSVRPPSEGGFSSLNVLNPGSDEAGERDSFQPGPDAILVGDFFYCQPEMNVFTSLQQRLDNLVSEMKGMALDPVSTKRPGDATATEKSIEASQAKSHLHEWAISFNATITDALRAAIYWMGEVDAEVECVINTDFKVAMTDTAGSTLIQLYMAGIIGRETVWEESKRKGVLGPTFDPEQEAQRIADEPPSFADNKGDDGGDGAGGA
jgi:hypothetical protein